MNATAAEGTPIIFDGWRSISIALYMALVGYTVMVTVPVLSTALVEKAGFTAEQVGRVWGADLGGLSLGAVISAFLVARMNRRLMVMAGAALTIAANGLCISSSNTIRCCGFVSWLALVAGFLQQLQWSRWEGRQSQCVHSICCYSLAAKWGSLHGLHTSAVKGQCGARLRAGLPVPTVIR